MSKYPRLEFIISKNSLHTSNKCSFLTLSFFSFFWCKTKQICLHSIRKRMHGVFCIFRRREWIEVFLFICLAFYSLVLSDLSKYFVCVIVHPFNQLHFTKFIENKNKKPKTYIYIVISNCIGCNFVQWYCSSVLFLPFLIYWQPFILVRWKYFRKTRILKTIDIIIIDLVDTFFRFFLIRSVWFRNGCCCWDARSHFCFVQTRQSGIFLGFGQNGLTNRP